MNRATTYRPPDRWLRVGKYLFPRGIPSLGWRRTRSPRQQVRMAQLAAEHPERVTLHAAGRSEAGGHDEGG